MKIIALIFIAYKLPTGRLLRVDRFNVELETY